MTSRDFFELMESVPTDTTATAKPSSRDFFEEMQFAPKPSPKKRSFSSRVFGKNKNESRDFFDLMESGSQESDTDPFLGDYSDYETQDTSRSPILEKNSLERSPSLELGEPLPEQDIAPQKPTDWVHRSSDPNHPFKRTLREHPGKFAAALGIGALGAQEGFMRGGRRQGEFEGVPSLDLFGVFGAEKPPEHSDQMIVDELRNKIYESVNDEEVLDILDKAEMLGGVLPAETAIFKGVAALRKLGEFNTAIGRIAKADNKSRFDVLGDLWNASKNYLKEKFKWPESKIHDFEKGKVTVLTPEESEVIVDRAKTLEKEVIPGEAKRVPTEGEESPTIVKQPQEEISTEIGKPEQIEPIQESLNESIPTEKEEALPPISGYVRKPTPETFPEKVKHLVQKIKESQKYIDSLKKAIAENRHKLRVAEAKYKEDPSQEMLSKVTALRSGLEQKEGNLRSEKKYIQSLKDDIRNLKRNKEQSTVQVPLGSPEAIKVQQPRSPERAPRSPVIGKKQAVARSKVMNLFRKAFTDPLVVGKKKMRMKQAAGEHYLWAKISRLVKENDIETAAHEIGHNLHTVLYGGDAKTPKEQVENINKALRPYLDELKPLALYEPWGMEGFAEFTRMYVTNPDVARKLAPKFYDKFEADLDAQYPELKNALLQARNYYSEYLEGTPESRIRAQTSYAEDASKLDNMIEWVKKHLDLDKLKTNYLDDVFPAKRLVAEAFGIPLTEVENLKDPRNLYRSLRVLKGAIGKADVFLSHETFDAKTLKRKGRGLRQILRGLKTKEEYKQFNDYLIARRAVEKAAQGIETGINLGDAIFVEQSLAPKYKKMAILLDHYNDALLTYARDGGLLSGEQYAMIKKNNMMYTPFQRVHEKESGRGLSSGGRLQAGKPIKRMKGSQRDIIAPIESVIKNTYAIIVNAEKNMSGQVLAELAKMKGVGRFVQRVPTPMELKGKIGGDVIADKLAREFVNQGLDDLVEIDEDGKVSLREDIASAIPEVFMKFGPGTYPAGENIITVFENGKPTYFEVSPPIYQMWTKGIAPYTASLLTKILRIPARTLRAGAILNPKFMFKNVVRDTWGGVLFTKYGQSIKDPVELFLDTIYSPLAGLAVAARQSKLYVEWMKAGGGMSTMQSMDREAVAKKLKEIRDRFSLTHPIKILRKVAEISEEANRLAEFGRALAVEGETRLGKEIAAFASRDLSIDFAKMGLQTKMINQLVPFFNATLQGGDKLLRTLGSSEDRAEFLLRAVGFILIPSLIVAWLNQGDDRVDEFYEEEKDFNFISFVGNTAIKIPVPFETGVLVHGLTQRMYKYFMNKDPHAFEGFMGSILAASVPNILPAMANPIIESLVNRNFFTGAPIIPAAKKDLIAKYQYKHSDSLTSRLIGRAMAYMLGEDTRSKVASPAIIDHFINSWGAGLGRLTVKLLDDSLEAAGLGDQIPKPEKSIAEKYDLDAFIARYPRASTRSIEKFYEYYADATARQKSIKYAENIELESPEEIQKAYERVTEIYDYPTLKRAYNSMKMSQRAINEIWLSPDIDPHMKRVMIDNLYEQQIAFAKAAVDDIEKYRLAVKGAK